jgi:hypothetical protein
MPFYEHVVISRQDISPQQAEALNDQLQTLITEGGGSVAKIEYWGCATSPTGSRRTARATTPCWPSTPRPTW